MTNTFNTTVLYFSATGNSLYVAKSLGGKTFSIPQMIKNNEFSFKNEKIGIVFPIYSWATNTFVLDFLKNAKFECDYLFAVGTFGIFSGGFASHLNSFAQENGLEFDYINAIKMVDNYIIGFNMNSQIKNEHKKQIEEQIALIKTDIDTSKKFIINESSLCKKATNSMVRGTLKKANKPDDKRGIKKLIKINNDCTKCGICQQVCPVGNITVSKEHGVQFRDKCFSCFSCIHNCPSNAMHLKIQMSKSRFRNKNVTLDDIIQSNNQN